MNYKTKFTLFTLGIIGIILIVFNSVEIWYRYNFKLDLEISKILYFFGLVSVGIYFFTEKYRKFLIRIMIITFGVSLLLNIYPFTENLRIILKQNRLSEYYELETCEKMEKRFITDLNKNEIKYFHFGIASISGMSEIMESNYNIEYFSMGCLLRSEMECYNELVYKYLKENYNKSINEIYEEIETE